MLSITERSALTLLLAQGRTVSALADSVTATAGPAARRTQMPGDLTPTRPGGPARRRPPGIRTGTVGAGEAAEVSTVMRRQGIGDSVADSHVATEMNAAVVAAMGLAGTATVVTVTAAAATAMTGTAVVGGVLRRLKRGRDSIWHHGLHPRKRRRDLPLPKPKPGPLLSPRSRSTLLGLLNRSTQRRGRRRLLRNLERWR